MTRFSDRPVSLPDPGSGRPDLLVIAGEHSGDQHGSRLICGMRELRPDLRIAAIGGRRMEEAGAQFLFPLTDYSVVGFFEVLRSYPFFKKFMGETMDWISRHRPRHLCLIDFPGFNLRLAERLRQAGLSRKGGGEMGVHYYIGPQIWAWKAGRRFQMARTLDSLGVIFPFEVDCYVDTDLPVSFVGHPFVESDFQLPVTFDPEGPVLLLPGSRTTAVSRIFPVMAEAFRLLANQWVGGEALVIYPDEQVLAVIEEVLKRRPEGRERFGVEPIGRSYRGRAVLTSSGTMSLICGLAGIPGAIVYRAHPFTYLAGRMLIQVKYLGIANLILDRPLYPEFIQGAAQPGRLAEEVKASINSEERREDCARASRELRAQLGGKEGESAPLWLARRLSG